MTIFIDNNRVVISSWETMRELVVEATGDEGAYTWSEENVLMELQIIGIQLMTRAELIKWKKSNDMNNIQIY